MFTSAFIVTNTEENVARVNRAVQALNVAEVQHNVEVKGGDIYLNFDYQDTHIVMAVMGYSPIEKLDRAIL